MWTALLLGRNAKTPKWSWDMLIPELQRGSFDMAMNGIEDTPERAKKWKPSDLPQAIEMGLLNGSPKVHLSAKTGHGLDTLRDAIRAILMDGKTDLTDDLVLTNSRQHEAIVKAISNLRTASDALVRNVPHEMALLDLYQGMAALDELTGDVVTDDILDRIFSTFCIGK